MDTRYKIMIASIALIVVVIIINNIRCGRFRKNLKPGLFCRFYIDEDSREGIVRNIDGDTIVITDSWLNVYTVSINDIYPASIFHF
ncbi:MAG TPA: hypothetical protein PKH58_01465 [Paludibacteraceae bacterium]|nr:hypothetical protein [Paludibacteraceae bacterium]